MGGKKKTNKIPTLVKIVSKFNWILTTYIKVPSKNWVMSCVFWSYTSLTRLKHNNLFFQKIHLEFLFCKSLWIIILDFCVISLNLLFYFLGDIVPFWQTLNVTTKIHHCPTLKRTIHWCLNSHPILKQLETIIHLSRSLFFFV